MKTWQMFKALTLEKKGKYIRKKDGMEITIKNGKFCWDSGYEFLDPDDEWEEPKMMKMWRNKK